ncbi:ATPase MORC2-like isoform X2 [Xenia sp. Carnegie-2017]|uniref:ATPase MORC2-like isoform X2 n=1 Tax=Xenia sp. Carnegie-2017 TaxID=2897299 RepID=UPI001F04C782|nr:ATPase MORC2-like isoform X2 [Xenia sp. Carnegie-2017]
MLWMRIDIVFFRLVRDRSEMAQQSSSYSTLSRAQLTVEYLHTNSTTHEFLFGALAELVDNARDAGATKMDIFSVPNNDVLGKHLLCFCDDGSGMDPTEVANVIQFGRSTKRVMDSKMIGQYGNGLKSGSMRIGKDMILFTKKHGTMSCLFLSRTFHEREGISEVVVPIPSWDVATKKPLGRTKRELEKHEIELSIILKYSPFKTEKDLLDYFDKIKTKGTMIMVYNLKLLDSGETELEVCDDDFVMRELHEEHYDDKSVMPERKSFRAYSSILYLDPRMKIYIQNKKVLTKRLGDNLFKPRSYLFSSKRFKTRSEREANKAMVAAKSAADKARELETIAKELQAEEQTLSKESRARLRQAQDNALKARTEADIKNHIAMTKKKSLNEPKTLTFTFGFNINRRHSYGMFVYNCNRLIKMYEKSGFQSDGKRTYAGIVGFVDVPYLVLEPTHNKQDFADAKEYKHLLRSMADHLAQYWKDSGFTERSLDGFWKQFGYISNDVEEEPSDEPKYARKRAMQLPCTVQCVKCLKWRTLPFSAKNIGRTFDDEWTCALNSDPERNKCTAPELKSIIPVGSLKKQVKTAEEKQRELMDDIKKKTEKLNQLDVRNTATPDAPTKRVLQVPPRSTTTPSPIPTSNRGTSQTVTAPSKTNSNAQKERTPTTTKRSTPYMAPKPSSTMKQTKAVKPVSVAVGRLRASPPYKDAKTTSDKPTAKLTPIARQPNVENNKTSNNLSSVLGSNKREHPTAEREICEVQPKRMRKEISPPPKSKEVDPDENSDTATSDGTTASSNLSKYKKGAAVEVFISPKWYKGKVVAVKYRKETSAKVKVKFDSYQKDKYDKWYDESDADIKLFSEEYATSEDSGKLKPTTLTNPKGPLPATLSAQREATITSSANENASLKETIIVLDKMLRSCVSYILVPEFPTTGRQLDAMSLESLQNFPLDKLFDVHSDSMKAMMDERSNKLMAEKIAEKEKEIVEITKRETECRTKLSGLRRTAAKLIRALNENPEDSSIAPEEDSDQVDILLEAIAEQALTSDAI